MTVSNKGWRTNRGWEYTTGYFFRVLFLYSGGGVYVFCLFTVLRSVEYFNAVSNSGIMSRAWPGVG